VVEEQPRFGRNNLERNGHTELRRNIEWRRITTASAASATSPGMESYGVLYCGGICEISRAHISVSPCSSGTGYLDSSCRTEFVEGDLLMF